MRLELELRKWLIRRVFQLTKKISSFDWVLLRPTGQPILRDVTITLLLKKKQLCVHLFGKNVFFYLEINFLKRERKRKFFLPWICSSAYNNRAITTQQPFDNVFLFDSANPAATHKRIYWFWFRRMSDHPLSKICCKGIKTIFWWHRKFSIKIFIKYICICIFHVIFL